MLKKTLSLLLSTLLCCSLVVAVFAAEGNSDVSPEPVTEAVTEEIPQEPVSFYVNNQPIHRAHSYTLRGLIYVPVTTFFKAVLAEYSHTFADDLLTVTGTTVSGAELTVSARINDAYLVANGRHLYVPNGITLTRGCVMAPISVLASIFNGTVFLDGDGICHATLGKTLIESGETFYDAEQLDLLSRLIYSESGNQPLKGKIAVGNVIMNRVENKQFPSTIYDVIYAKNQFCVVRNGSINLKPNDESVVAAKLTLEGVRVTTALYFNRSGLNSWASRNCTHVATIGNHDFFA